MMTLRKRVDRLERLLVAIGYGVIHADEIDGKVLWGELEAIAPEVPLELQGERYQKFAGYEKLRIKVQK